MQRAGARRVGWYLAFGAALTVVAAAAPTTGERDTAYDVACVMLIVAALVSRHRTHLSGRATALIITAIVSLAAAQSLRDSTTAAAMFGHSSLRLVGILGLIAAAVAVVRRRPPARPASTVVDAVVLALGGWLIGWIAFVRPMAGSQQGKGGATLAVDGLFLPATVVLLCLVALIVSARTRPRLALQLLGGALVVDVVGHIITALVDAHDLSRWFDRLGGGCNVAAYVVAGAALVHWSAAEILTTSTQLPLERRFGRLVLTTSAVLLAAIVLAATDSHDSLDKWVRIASVVVLGCATMLRVVMSLHDTTETDDEQVRGAQTDALTGLPNRTMLLAKITECVTTAWSDNRQPALYVIDLDRFKNINDSLGHAAGDELLVMVAQRLRAAVPAHATVARLSGDEYVVLEPAAGSAEAAMALADRLLGLFREPLTMSHGDVFVTASIGMAYLSSRSSSTAEDLLRHADTAMYRAKDAGRNCVALYDESMHQRVAQRLSLETALYRALDREELRMFHQPILDLDTGDVEGFEALMRWRRDDGTEVSPVEFIPIAEDTGTINAIGAWALLEALVQLRHWIDDGVCGSLATMSVNVSPRQLADPGFPAMVGEALTRSSVSPRQLWLEVTEGIMITEPELALATLQRVRSLGVRVALDDFGTGYSSLSLLQRFPLQRIKIDRAFVLGVADNPNDRSLVRTIVAMGRSLDLDIVAEGVETVQQMQALSDLGCKKAQGYLISRPIPAEAMRTTVAALERLGSVPGLRTNTAARAATTLA